MHHLREIFHLTVPILMANLALIGGSVIDTIWLGHYSSIDLAAMSVSFAIYGTVYGLCTGLLSGLRQILAQAYGTQDETILLKTIQQGILVTLLASLLGSIIILWCANHLAVFGISFKLIPVAEDCLIILACGFPLQLLYRVFQVLSQTMQRAYRVVWFNAVGLVLRASLSGLLIYGIFALPELGAKGAALALILNVCLLFPLFIYHASPITNYPSWKLLIPTSRPDFKIIRDILHLGIPSAASTSADMFSSSATTTIIASLGMVASASHQIVSNLNTVFYLIHTALSAACGILVSQRMGQNDQKEAKAIAWFGLKINTCLALLIMLAILLLRDDMAKLYTSDLTVQTAVAPLLIILCLYHFFDAQSTIIGELLYCWKSTIVQSAIHIVVFCLGSLLLGWYLAKFGWHWGFQIAPMGVIGFWIMIAATSFVSVALNFILLCYVLNKPK